MSVLAQRVRMRVRGRAGLGMKFASWFEVSPGCDGILRKAIVDQHGDARCAFRRILAELESGRSQRANSVVLISSTSVLATSTDMADSRDDERLAIHSKIGMLRVRIEDRFALLNASLSMTKKKNLAAGLEFGQNLLGNLFQRFEDAYALESYRFYDGFVLAAEFGGEHVDGQNVGQISLVELQNVRNLVEVVAVFFQVRHQVIERFDVRVLALLLRVGDENDAIHAAQDQLAAGVIEDLSGDGIEMDASLEAADVAQVERQEIEEQGTLGLGGQRDHLALLLGRGFLVDDLQIRGLAAESGAIVHDFAVDLAGCEVDETQGLSSKAGPPLRALPRTPMSLWRLGLLYHMERRPRRLLR